MSEIEVDKVSPIHCGCGRQLKALDWARHPWSGETSIIYQDCTENFGGHIAPPDPRAAIPYSEIDPSVVNAVVSAFERHGFKVVPA